MSEIQTESEVQDRIKKYNIDRIIVCAAIRFSSGLVVCSARHYDPRMRDILKFINGDNCSFVDEEQGFVDQWGVFLSRKQAMEIVKSNDQPFSKERNGDQDKELYSEGLY